MEWHENVLDKSGREAAGRLSAVLGGDFYLAGGTALALRLGHRISLDLDLFSPSCALTRGDRLVLKEKLKASGHIEVVDEKDGTYHLRLGTTAVSLFHYPYPELAGSADWNGLKVASVEDIAAMKLAAVLGRGSKKDFIDLYFIFRLFRAARVMAWGARKFPDQPNFELQAAKALVYFDDAEKEPAPRMLKTVVWKDVKRFFEREIPRFFDGRGGRL